VVETSANNNDWDGAGNTGALNAISGDLEIRDTAAFPFQGSVQADADREVFANGFELEFEPASSLTLNGGRYRAINTTRFGGTITVGTGQSELEIGGTAIFEATSATTITGTLLLNSPATQIDPGATFAGGGSLLNTESNFLRLQDGADIDVLVRNPGDLVIGTTGPAQATGLDYEQDATATWLVDIGGVALDEFDRYTLTGAASLAGKLIIDLEVGFVPALGDSFSILSAVGGVTGTFTSVQEPADMPAGLVFDIEYQPQFVRLVVVEQLPGDYNFNGVVDAADYVVWRKNNGSQAGYDAWRTNFGRTAGNGAGTSARSLTSVPEPGWIALLVSSAILLLCLPRRILASLA
jgi:hypothetical protein